MIKKEVEYENFEGEKVTKTLYFHMTEQELKEIGLNREDLSEKIIAAYKNGDVAGLYNVYKNFVLAAYGVKLDSDTFVKNTDEVKNFEYTLAFSALMTEITKDPESLYAFMRGVLPKSVASELPTDVNEFTEAKVEESIENLEKIKENAKG